MLGSIKTVGVLGWAKKIKTRDLKVTPLFHRNNNPYQMNETLIH